MSKDSTPDPERTPLTRRRGARLAALATAAVVIAAGGTFWMSGGYDAWRNDQALDSACDGDLAAQEVRGLLPGVELTASSELRQDGWECSVTAADPARDGDASVTVGIRNVDEPFAAGESVAPGAAAVPLGGGWTGSFTYGAVTGGGAEVDARETDRARVVLLVDCGSEPGDGLLAWADGRTKRGADFRSQDARVALTRVLTETTLSHARRTGCEPERAPEPLERVAAPAAGEGREPQPLDRASGTCAGVLAADTARRWGVGTAVETAAEPAAVERCVLGSRLGAALYTLTASYGPYGEAALAGPAGDVRSAKGAAESASGRYRMTARCPGAGGTAVYDVAPDDGLALDHPSLRSALQAFASRSAERHGCEPPA
ncbi:MULTISPECIES: hypothetical protein [unclassified Streptomyces]|uniref:hypothetical protein n=1 Tax=unclassified Streptomyces TaxID=2593676 RepID=UPI0008DE3D07|nr:MULTISPECIES: hypothetical protein [unclassified Streptomyces]OII65129.1 hypothetical protein BJP39_29150 [Streptomyces sp. CC77]